VTSYTDKELGLQASMVDNQWTAVYWRVYSYRGPVKSGAKGEVTGKTVGTERAHM